ncbi:MAG TPA: hypothetical protein VK050_02555 [Flavobacteriaceae bacterium]|nr:hypothetical protein [Flavobacteriaceae bacterium]
MRKLVYIITLSFTLLLISTTIHAQGLTVSGDRPEDIAKAKVSMLQDELKLSGNQQRALFRAYVKREVGIKKHVADKDGSSPAVLELKSKLEQDLEKAVKKELTAEQFATWKKEFAGK